MNSKESAFNDALVIVATSNTATYLINRLQRHPLVQYLGDTFSLQQLKAKLLLELKGFDKSLQATTVILLLTQAIVNKCGTKPIPTDVFATLKKSKVMWTNELLSIAQFVKRDSTVTVANFRSSPRVQSPAGPSSTSSSFINL